MRYELNIVVDDEENKTIVSGKYDPWMTVGLLLEALLSEVDIASKYKEMQKEKVIDYCCQYLQMFEGAYETERESGA